MIRFRLAVAALLTAAAVMTAVAAPAEQVPNVLEMHYDSAKRTLQGAGFTVNDKGFHPTSNQRIDRLILSQEPAPGTAAARGAIVRITPLVYIEPRVLSQMPKPPALSPESQRVLSQLEQGKNPQQAQPSQPPQAKPPQPSPPRRSLRKRTPCRPRT